MSFSGINAPAIVVAIIINMALAYLWYGPLFGKAWMKLIGKKAKDQPWNLSMIIVPALATFLSVGVLSTFKRATGLSGVISGITIWTGFVALTSYTNDLREGRAVKLWLINNIYHLVGFILSGLALDLIG